MSKFNQKFGKFISISTYAIIFCIIGNMVVPAMIVESVQAQAISSSSTTQPKLSAADQKILDKAKADAKAVTNKELGLLPAEIAFTNSFDMDTINQKVDKYVNYDKNGVATLNANAYRHDGTVKLSRINTEFVISIANKMITKYNNSINSIKTDTITSSNAKGLNVASSNTDNSNFSITKTVVARGVNITITSKQTNGGVQALSLSAPSSNRTQITNYGWWGFDLFISHELINKMWWAVVGGGIAAVIALLYTNAAIAGACALGGPPSWILCGAGVITIAYLTWALRNDDIYCGERGVYYRYHTWGGGGSTKDLCR